MQEAAQAATPEGRRTDRRHRCHSANGNEVSRRLVHLVAQQGRPLLGGSPLLTWEERCPRLGLRSQRGHLLSSRRADRPNLALRLFVFRKQTRLPNPSLHNSRKIRYPSFLVAGPRINASRNRNFRKTMTGFMSIRLSANEAGLDLVAEDSAHREPTT